jgi:feruloyl esterase
MIARYARIGGAILGLSFTTGAGLAGGATAQSQDDGSRCAALAGTLVEGARIEGATLIRAGTKLAPLNIPARNDFCKVRAIVSPTSVSLIRIEIWLPTAWNGKMLGLGGSGTSGGTATAALTFPKPVGDGYVTIATDAGHDNTDQPVWALERERIADYGDRANHLGAQVAKALIARYYGRPAQRAYFQGCSNGGRDALMLAQRHPTDYDGIIAGAPASNFVSLLTGFTAYRSAVEKLPPNSLTPKLGFLHAAVLKQCDARDGLADGIVSDPRGCRFDPAVLSCRPGQDTKSCLAPAEVSTFRLLYQGARTSSGRLVHPGLPVGSEYLWDKWWTQPNSTGGDFAEKLFGYFVYKNPQWRMADFDLDKDWPAAMRAVSGMLDATNPDMRRFVRGGGKLIMYNGWDDQAVSPYNTLNYFGAAQRTLGAAAADSTRLFMVPGMGHCFDGNGFTSADWVGSLDRWVENGTAPQRIVAEKPVNALLALAGVPAKPLMTRPLCAWPKVARYDGKGAPEAEASFACVDAGRPLAHGKKG